MKKIVLIVTMFFTFWIVPAIIHAENDAEYAKALQSYNSGKYSDAVVLFKEYIKKKPDSSAYYRIGYALYELGKYDEADEYFHEAYFINPDFSPELTISPEKYAATKTKKMKKPSHKRVTSKSKARVAKTPPVPPEGKSPSNEPQKVEPTKKR